MSNPEFGPLVYIVDDEPMIRKAMKQSIISMDCRVECFESAEICVAVLKERACQLLITDINMPGMNGMDLLRHVKSEFAHIAVIVVTGFGEIPVAVEAMKLGAVDFIQKPLDERTLLPAVQLGLKHGRLIKDLGLTVAELKVLKHVAHGKSNKEIAYILDLSVRTVENQRHRLMKKLDLQSTADLVRLALSLELVSVDSTAGD